MKKNTFFLTILLLLCAIITYAQNNDRPQFKKLQIIENTNTFQVPVLTSTSSENDQIKLGYCSTELTAVGVGNNRIIKAAIKLPKENLVPFVGKTITQIMVGSVATTSNVSIFLTYDLDATPFYTQSVSLASNGWNTLSLATPYMIEADKDIYVGYQAKLTQGVCAVDTERANPNGDYLTFTTAANGTTFYDWDHLPNLGVDCNNAILAVVTGDGLPQNDLKLQSISLPYSALNPNQNFTLNGVIANNGAAKVTSFDISCQIDNLPPTIHSFSSLSVDNYEKYEFAISGLQIADEGEHTLTVTITNVNTQNDDNPADNTLSKIILVAQTPTSPTIVGTVATNKNALIEEFTGIGCQWCPDGHKRANQIMNANPGRVMVINIHQGGYAAAIPDYRTEWGDAIADLSGLEGYPAAMVNRHLFSGTVLASTDRTSWATKVGQILSQPSYVNMAVQTDIEAETRQLTVDVELYFSDNATTDNMLNVALIQDSIMGPQSFAQGLTYPEMQHDAQYQHNHMLRDLLTGQWGDSIKQNVAGTFIAKRYVYTVPTSIRNIPLNIDKLQVVAFVTEGKKEIISCAKATVSGTTPVETVKNIGINVFVTDNFLFINTDKDIKNIEIFNVTGQKVLSSNLKNDIPLSNLSAGIYLVKINIDGKDYMQKVIVK
ncbi:hypothetical protein FACS189429_6070 [Bacteroidia bacterium]|nr:hypothetical protein FACS189429_6070 [Bacteroidia bacterium]